MNKITEIEKVYEETKNNVLTILKEEDTYDWCTSNAVLNIEAINRLITRDMGAPISLGEGPNADAEWHGILRKIIIGFKAGACLNDFPDDRNVQTLFEDGMLLFIEWYPHLWD